MNVFLHNENIFSEMRRPRCWQDRYLIKERNRRLTWLSFDLANICNLTLWSNQSNLPSQLGSYPMKSLLNNGEATPIHVLSGELHMMVVYMCV